MDGGWLAALEWLTRGINRAFTAIAGLLALVIMLVILQDVIRRYAFNDPSVWALDVSSFLLVYLFFLALAPTLERGSHVSVDLFNDLMPPGMRRPMILTGHVLIVAFGCLFAWQLLNATIDAFIDNELFPTATPVKVKYIWIIGPVGTLQFVLTALVSLGKAARRPAEQG